MISPFAKPLYVMAKPAGAMCNLRCEYCYYLEKQFLYKGDGQKDFMSDDLLEHYIKEYISAQTTEEVQFCWHGGEPLLRERAFYEKALKLQGHYAQGHKIDNVIQTNGYLINDDWARFFAQHHFLVGVSIDGPKEFHDGYRISAGGKPTWERVMKGIECLNRYNVEWNAMAVVNNLNADHPLEFYRFFKQIGCKFIQFTPIVERIVAHADGRHLANPQDTHDWTLTPFSVTPHQWGSFLCTLFDEWVHNDVGEIFVQMFDSTLANWMGVTPSVCSLAKDCGHAGVMEHNGDIYSCDHFVFPEYKLGNIRENTIVELMYGEKQKSFGRMKQGSLPEQCQKCEWLFACNGECPRNRFMKTTLGERGLNYLCGGYHKFFEHAAPYFDIMKRLLQNEQPPSLIMKMLS